MDLHGPWVGPTSVAAVAVVVAGSRLVHRVEAKHDREGHEKVERHIANVF